MTFTTTLEKFDSNLWGHHIMVPNKVVQHFKKKGEKRFRCKLNDQLEFACAFMPAGDDKYFININKAIRTKLKLQIGTKVKAELSIDDSKYGMEMPEEFGELLAQDPEGSDHFHALTSGKQRNLIYLVAKMKSTDKRLEKALVIVEFLKTNKGKLDFKALNEAFKVANRR